MDDYEDDKIDIITGVQAHDIEIVPRKIVEMIIEMCDEIINNSEKAIASFKEIAYCYEDGVDDAIFEANIRKYVAASFKTYAESLLEQFEGNDNTEKPLPFD